MPLEFRDWFTSEMIAREPDTLFVFGDNLARYGRGGQAAACRGHVNAVGLPTKITPYQYCTDADLGRVSVENTEAMIRLIGHLKKGGLVVWPKDGIGTGLARLAEKAPHIAQYYREMLAALETVQPSDIE
jgi:hypothetical protein